MSEDAKRVRSIIARDKKRIEHALKKYLRRAKGPKGLCRAMKYSILGGGKRLRPILVLESARALGGDTEKALPFACAIECIHSFSLIHDDLPAMDDDDVRRGKPTCHRMFGEGMAILAGDGLLNLAFGILSRLRQKKTLEIMSVIADAVGTGSMIGGQALDLMHGGGRSIRRSMQYRIDTMKTAELMAASCAAGSLAAGAKAPDVKRLSGFGKDLGRAFQVSDDIIDSVGGGGRHAGMRADLASRAAKAKRHIAYLGKRGTVLAYIADMVAQRAER
jgi:geranylgeranyl diphosphate synthase type II